jgi:hypothetical protein
MRNLVAIVMLTLASPAAFACECSYSPLGDSTVLAAKSIFVFQLMSAEVEFGGEVEPAAQAVSARVKLVEHLGGVEDSHELMSYSTLSCCGSRLDVGHFYAAFLTEPAVPFVGHPGNLLHLGEYYRPRSSEALHLKSVVAGQRKLEEAYGKFPGERQHQISRPPTPCPQNTP